MKKPPIDLIVLEALSHEQSRKVFPNSFGGETLSDAIKSKGIHSLVDSQQIRDALISDGLLKEVSGKGQQMRYSITERGEARLLEEERTLRRSCAEEMRSPNASWVYKVHSDTPLAEKAINCILELDKFSQVSEQRKTEIRQDFEMRVGLYNVHEPIFSRKLIIGYLKSLPELAGVSEDRREQIGTFFKTITEEHISHQDSMVSVTQQHGNILNGIKHAFESIPKKLGDFRNHIGLPHRGASKNDGMNR